MLLLKVTRLFPAPPEGITRGLLRNPCRMSLVQISLVQISLARSCAINAANERSCEEYVKKTPS